MTKGDKQKKVQVKKLKNLLEKLYSRGVYDGIDIAIVPNDRFLGNMIARSKWEQKLITDCYKAIKKLL